ncbi:MAG: lysine--tRNA ligase [Bdellovibrionales bacterium]|nr:lysine--tRNA ligase [Bdellovibrionales bacterium]
MKDYNPIRLEKLRKLQILKDNNINPYPHTWFKKSWKKNKLSKIKVLKEKAQNLSQGDVLEKSFYLAGRLMRKRPMGKTSFFTLQAESEQFQCYIRKDSFISSSEILTKKSAPENSLNPWEIWKLCDIGDILSVQGKLFKTNKGEPSLKVQSLKILCKSIEPLPEKYHGLEDIEMKYRFRHLDLIMNQESRKVFEIRSKIIQEIRNFMSQKKFIEVETPVLQSKYGGAVAQPFETHFRRLGKQKMYLKISPEIYLKKLLVGGFEKVYEIGKNFRNEGIDRTHNPEFTMMEYYQAYTDYIDQMKFFKSLVNRVVKKIKGGLIFEYQGKKLDFSKWEKLSLKEAIKKYSSQEKLYENYQHVVGKETHGTAEKFKLNVDKLSFEKLLALMKKQFQEENYSFFENSQSFTKKQKNNLKDELIVMLFELLVEKHLWNPTFITDFPLFVSPLTKEHRKHKKLVERFEPYIAGMELGNAYTELNNPLDQKERLQNQERWSDSKDTNFKEAQIDENFIHALEVGMPPTGGVGLGIERLVMILTNQKSVRDCILFPAQRNF